MPAFDHTRGKTIRARTLRKAMTRYEKQLWQRLREGALGASFRRQHPVGVYIVDFAAPSISLVIEVDGGQHGTDEAVAHDTQRTQFLASRGWTVIRFWNAEIFDNLDGVVETIWHKVQEMQSHQPPP
jgi:very-short-patch-repair endonuclease